MTIWRNVCHYLRKNVGYTAIRRQLQGGRASSHNIIEAWAEVRICKYFKAAELLNLLPSEMFEQMRKPVWQPTGETLDTPTAGEMRVAFEDVIRARYKVQDLTPASHPCRVEAHSYPLQNNQVVSSVVQQGYSDALERVGASVESEQGRYRYECYGWKEGQAIWLDDLLMDAVDQVVSKKEKRIEIQQLIASWVRTRVRMRLLCDIPEDLAKRVGIDSSKLALLKQQRQKERETATASLSLVE